ncbi:MAG: beta-ketoacyl synthase [Planctomycetota bacterium]
MSARRVVVTGLGLVTPLGDDVERVFDRLVAGEVAVTAPRRPGLAEHAPPTQALAELPDELLARLRRELGPDAGEDVRTLAGVAAAEQALRHAGLDASGAPRLGVVLGSGPGHFDPARLAPSAGEAFDVARYAEGLEPGRPDSLGLPRRAEAPAALVARRAGTHGPVHAVTTACAAANQALGIAYRMIRRGEIDVAVAGGSDSMVNPQGLVFFVLLGAAAHVDPHDPAAACRPFDRKRSGLVMGEGAGCAVLEALDHARARGATILAEVTGYGATLDAWRITAPEPEGKGAAHAMRAALADGALGPGDIDFVNAHGTGTKRNDPAEVHAVKAAFGEHATKLAVTSSKGALGHLLSGAAGVAFVACVSALQRQAVPPTANLADPDRHCDLDHVPGQGRATPVRAAMNDAFAFGGQNACLVVSRFDEAGRGSSR